MIQAHTPLAVDSADIANATDVLAARMRHAPEHPAFERLVDAALVPVTTRRFDADARALAAGLVAQGLQPGDSVAVMAPTCYEWAVADFGCWTAGCVVVPIYETASVRQIADVAADAAVKVALAASDAQASMLRAAVPGLDVWTLDDGLRRLVDRGRGVPAEEVERRRRLAGRDDLATIVYTSGTTAELKGVRITHGNLVGLVQQIAHSYREIVNDHANTVIVLPLAHILARALQLAAVATGMRVLHVADPKKAVESIGMARPTFMVVVPRILQKISDAAAGKAADKGLGAAFRAARRTAVEWATVLEAQQDDPELRASLALRARHAFFDRLFYSRLRALLGGRLGYMLSGAAPLDADLARFFWGVGIPVIEGYGLTETTAPVTGNLIGDIRPGTVGVPVPGSAVRISDDGEVQVRGVGVTPGYQRAALDAAAFDDGWFRTGDLGRLDERGHLVLVGRAKNLIVTASGKNVAPEPWEEAVGAHPLVANAVMVGEGRPFLSALLLLERAEVIAWARRHKLDALAAMVSGMAASKGGTEVRSPDLSARLQQLVDRANARVSRAEQVKAFVPLIADTEPSSGNVTPTLKIRRDAVLAAAASHIEALYRR